MNIQAKVAQDKEKHPERFCRVSRCLWKVLVCDPMTREMATAKGCEGGYCPRHKHLASTEEAQRWTPETARMQRGGTFGS
jgi:hypothetical protein